MNDLQSLIDESKSYLSSYQLESVNSVRTIGFVNLVVFEESTFDYQETFPVENKNCV